MANRSGGGKIPQISGGAFEELARQSIVSQLEQVLTFGTSSCRCQGRRIFPHIDVFRENNCEENHIEVFYQNGFKKHFLEERSFKMPKFSIELRPDAVIYSKNTNRIAIIEMKNQTQGGSVDEKLQTAHFKQWYYRELLRQSTEPLVIDVVCLLSSWFDQKKYETSLAYMKSVGAIIQFDTLDLKELGFI